MSWPGYLAGVFGAVFFYRWRVRHPPWAALMENKQSTPSAGFLESGLRVARQLGMAWTLTWIVLCIDAIWLLLAGWSVSGHGVAVIALAVAAFRAPLMISRYRNDTRIRTTAGASALLIVFMAGAATLSYLVVSTNAPLVDAQLAAWDSALGFDWLAMSSWLQTHPPVQTVLHFAYHSGLVQLVLVVLFLGFSSRPERLDEFMRLFIVGTLLTILLSGLLPAAGAWKYHVPTGSFDLSTLSHFELLRDGRMRDIPLREMQGLIAMPSLHTAMAVLFVYAMRCTRLVVPVFVVNVAMLVSTPVDGGHYVVDVLAGAVLAIGMIVLERRHSMHPRVAENTLPTAGLGALRR